MLSLLLTLMSIGLLAVMVVTSVSYLPLDEDVILGTGDMVHNGLIALQTGYNNYVSATGSTPTSNNWTSILTPEYVFLPATPKGMSWSYTSGAPYGSATGNYFCLSGSITAAQYQGIVNQESQFSSQAYFISSTCGATTNAPAPGNWPANVAITYWVHVN
jgi:hypothetical protein